MKGLFVIISSPSGGGKNSVIRAVMEQVPRSTRLISTTTRPLRPREVDGVDYHFVSEEEFAKKIEDGAFIEHNEYAGNRYGTQRKDLETLLETHNVVFSQMEVNGKQHFDRLHIPNLSLFLLPDNMHALEDRIRVRGGLSEEKIAERIAIAKKEIEASKGYDYRILNIEGKMDDTVSQIVGIVRDHQKA